jgi:cytochrome c oxidase subunit II
MLAGSAALFVLVMAVFALVYRRPGWGASVSPYRWILLGGLVLPGVVLLPLLAYGLVAGERLLPLPGSTPPRIEARAERWQWSFAYPGEGGVTTAGVLHLPAGVPVDVVVTSQDVIHAFWIPRLAGKIDVLPGHENVLRIQADRPGHYEGLCAEFCGVGHARMRFEVVVHPTSEFAAAIAQLGSKGEAKP